MPPLDTTPQSTIRYLTRLLAAVIRDNDGELRIKRKTLRAIEDENARQALFEDVDSAKDEIVLRFGSKHSAVYPVEADCKTPQPVVPAQPPRPNAASATETGSSLPFTDDQLARAERKIAQMRNLHAIRSEKPQPR